MGFSAQVMETFILEAKELLAKMEEALLKLDQGEQNLDLINDIFRSAHTLKGTAGMFGFTELSNFSHEIETLLATFRENKIIPSNTKITILLESIDCLTNLVTASVQGDIGADLLTTKQNIITKLKTASDDQVSTTSTENTKLKVEIATNNISPSNHNADVSSQKAVDSHLEVNTSQQEAKGTNLSVNAVTQQESISTNQCVNPVNQESISTNQGANLANKEVKINNQGSTINNNTSNQTTSANTIANFIKIDSIKLDEIINLIGEVVIVQEYINSLMNNQTKLQLLEAVERISKLIDNLRVLSLQLRMQPIKEIFSKFNRVVRDIATQQNKQIKLQVSGEDTELDKVIIEKISDPLLHLIRNACDHGIDPVEERGALGKPAYGSVTLQASQENGEVLIKVMDDGRGMDLDRIKQKAINLGMLNKDLELSEQQILSYIFEPGFSTSEQITDISGRGVGMDVVKKEIEKLHGSVSISSKKTKGTCIAIRLPLTLAIVDGVLIKISEFYCVVPMWNITECIAITTEEYKSIILDGYLNFRNTILPVLILNDFWQIAKTSNLPSSTIIIIQHAEHKIGILIDQLIGTVQTVIKSMPEIFSSLKWANGAAILGNGTIAVILDIPGLIFDVIAKDQHRAIKVTAV